MVEVIIPTKSPEGITFYISPDGEDTGVSVKGLSRLATGRNSGDIFSENRNLILFQMSNGQGDRETASRWLKPCWGNVFREDLKGADRAKIVSQQAAVAIITYFAIEKENAVAQHSLTQFAQKGFNTWVKEITNFTLDGKYDKLIGLVQELMTDVKEMKVKVNKLDRLEGTTLTFYPGLAHINGTLSNEDKQQALSSSDLYTVKDWLALNKIQLDKSRLHSFALLSAETYRTLTQQDPKAKYKPYSRKDGRTTWQKDGNGYRLGDFHILEAAYQKLLIRQT